MDGFQYKDLTDVMLEDAEAVMAMLCRRNEKETGRFEFTSQQFLKHVAQQHQDEYVQLLERCRVHFPDWIFNKAHESIGHALKWRAKRAGYFDTDEGNTETDIFDNPTGRITYRLVTGD